MADDYSKFSEDLTNALKNENVKRLDELYILLSEEKSLSKAKRICMKLYENAYADIVSVIKLKRSDLLCKYFCWHFLQLMTSCLEVKDVAQKDFTLLPALMDFLVIELESPKKQESLQIISLNYLILMLGGADNTYYDHVVSSGAMTFIHNVLQACSLSSTDPMIESVILVLSLLLEGTDSCKKKIIDLDFPNLLSKKLQDRSNCEDNLFKIASMTHQKMLLLTSDTQAFVETFRKEFDKEAEKQPVYQKIYCSFVDCDQNNKNYGSYKRCSRCKTVIYCSKGCQVKHWKGGHSKQCKVPI